MQTATALLASGLLISIILISTSAVALVVTPNRGPPQSVIVPKTTFTETTNATTKLLIHLAFPNGTRLSNARLFAGSVEGKSNFSGYLFSPIAPGTFPLAVNGTNSSIYLPYSSVQVLPGVNIVNLTVYNLQIFTLVVFPNLTFNHTSPGPPLVVTNNTAVRFVVVNNSTLIQNVAVTNSLTNTSYANVLFNSLSNTLSAGGTVNDTFIVSQTGFFYYECLIGNDAKLGEYGSFVVGL